MRTDGRPSGVAVASTISSPCDPFVEELQRVVFMPAPPPARRAASGSATAGGRTGRQRSDRRDPERRAQPDHRAEHPADRGPERAHAVVHDHERARDARAERGRDHARGRSPRPGCRAASGRSRTGTRRRTAWRRTSQCGPPAAGTSTSGAGKRKQPIMNAGPTPIRREMRAVTTEPNSVPIDATPSTTPSVAGRTCERARRIEEEQREEHEVEEVERRDAEQLGADDRVAADPARAREHAARVVLLVRRVGRVDPAHEERRPDVRDRVERERVRPAEKLHEHAAEARAREERERAAAVREGVGRDVVLAAHDRLEERRRTRRRRRRRACRCRTRRCRGAAHVRWPSAYAIGTVAIRSPRQMSVTSITWRRPARRSTQLPAWSEKMRFGTSAIVVSAPICAGRRIEREHRGQRQRDQRDLVADERHRLPDEVAAEVRVLAEQRRQHRTQDNVQTTGRLRRQPGSIGQANLVPQEPGSCLSASRRNDRRRAPRAPCASGRRRSNGFCRNAMPGSSTPWCPIDESV